MADGLKLNLSGAKEVSFEPVDTAWYEGTIYEVSVVETENPEGKLPVGTPGINVQFKIDANGQDRRVFRRYFIAPDGYEKKDVLDGMLYSFLKDAGEAEEDLRKKSYQLVPEDLQGRPIRVKVKYVKAVKNEDGSEKYPAKNEVQATKPAGEGVEDENALGLLA